MPLELPNLDDRTYDDLVAEALSLIPTYAPEWTNHNPSDPGITLIELFAYLTEMQLYRINRVTDANKAIFLKLILGADEWNKLKIRVLKEKQPLSTEEEQRDDRFIRETLDSQTLEREIQTAIKQLRQSDRAVTCKDFETLALRANEKVARAKCIPRRNLELAETQRFVEKPGHVSIIIVPVPEFSDASNNPDSLLKAVGSYLEPKRLLTNRLHIVEPRYLTIQVQIMLVLKPGSKAGKVEDIEDLKKQDSKNDSVLYQVVKALEDFFSPLLKDGSGWKGWAFGRSIYVSEIYELLDRQSSVDYVTPIKDKDGKLQDEIVIVSQNNRDDNQRKQISNGALSAVKVYEDELVKLQIKKENIDIDINKGYITFRSTSTSVIGG